MELVDAATGDVLDPVLVDRASGRPLSEIDAVFRAGPAASADMRDRFDELQRGTVLSERTGPRARRR